MLECENAGTFVAIKGALFLTLQAQEKDQELVSSRETRKIQQEKPYSTWNPPFTETDDFVQMLECFQRNSAGSACPNAAKAIFASSEEVGDLLKRL